MSNYYDQLTRQYPVTKTIRQELRPVGKTLENFKRARILENDLERKEAYQKVKNLLDDFHKQIIEEALDELVLEGLEEVEYLFEKSNKSEDEKQKLDDLLDSMRKSIAKALKEHKDYKLVGTKDLIEKELPLRASEANDGDAKKALSCFKRFTTYFTDYNKNRQNIYSEEEKHSTVGYRCINENLFIFLSNLKIYRVFKRAHISIDGVNEETLDKTFMIDSFNDCLNQSGIDAYNSVVAMVKTASNLYDQQNKTERDYVKIPKMKFLYKQILSEKSNSFDDTVIQSDDALIACLNDFVDRINNYLSVGFDKYIQVLIESKNGNGIFVKNDNSLTMISNYVTDSWGTIRAAFNDRYDMIHTEKRNEKYEEKRDKAFKTVKSFEVSEISELIKLNVIDGYVGKIKKDVDDIKSFCAIMTERLDNHDTSKKLQKNIKAVESIKDYLDSVKVLERDIKLFNGTGKENRNEFFYGEQFVALDEVACVDELYNLTRNYLTKKPFSSEKIKLNFNNPQLLGGWDVNKESNCYGVLFLRDNCFYLGIMDKAANHSFENLKESTSDDLYQKVNCKYLPGPNKMFPKVFFSEKQSSVFDPTREMKSFYKKNTYKKGKNFNKNDCHTLIDFYKQSIKKHDDWRQFNFKFSETKEYEDISGFFREVEAQNYKISFTNVDSEYIDSLVESGQLYLFQIYNKDFSGYSTGNLNLHTLYLRMLFDDRNLKNICLKLNGEAEVFYRPSSILDEDKIVHKAKQSIKNKNPNSTKSESVFDYDIIKDKRYTEDKFFLHLPITLNFNEQKIFKYNEHINEVLRQSQGVRTIGIDRGERNLLYIVVCDTDGSILYQRSLNEIISGSHKTDYHRLLDEREKERLVSRRDWRSIENIKDLKAGYLSQVVNEIYNLILKYNAVVVLEDLNMGFKNGRKKVEKQVYQNFEKALIDKLNFLCVDKSRAQQDPSAPGGVLNAYQLTAPFDSFEKIGKQTGCIFYVPAYLTSQIDPTTGFANLFYQKDTSKDGLKRFFGKFKEIHYSKETSDFEFRFDYNDFTYKAQGTRTEWTISTHGTRITKFRSEEANGNWVSRTVYPTEIIKSVLAKNNISYIDGQDLVESFMSIDNAADLKELLYGFKLAVQLRNSTLASDVEQEDYIISPVKNDAGYYFDSRQASKHLPTDADANGAYNIARKGLWALDQIREAKDLSKVKLAISNKEWFDYAQSHIPVL